MYVCLNSGYKKLRALSTISLLSGVFVAKFFSLENHFMNFTYPSLSDDKLRTINASLFTSSMNLSIRVYSVESTSKITYAFELGFTNFTNRLSRLSFQFFMGMIMVMNYLQNFSYISFSTDDSSHFVSTASHRLVLVYRFRTSTGILSYFKSLVSIRTCPSPLPVAISSSSTTREIYTFPLRFFPCSIRALSASFSFCPFLKRKFQ